MMEDIMQRVRWMFMDNPKAKRIRNKIYAALLILMLLLLLVTEGFD